MQRLLREANKLQQSDIVALFALYSEVSRANGNRVIYLIRIKDALVSLSIDMGILESELEKQVKDGVSEFTEDQFLRFVRGIIEEGERRVKDAVAVDS